MISKGRIEQLWHLPGRQLPKKYVARNEFFRDEFSCCENFFKGTTPANREKIFLAY